MQEGETFIGRKRELAALDAAHASPRSELIPIYGRRRVGKSELIHRFLAGKPGIYFMGKQAPAAIQIRELLREASIVVGEPLLATYPAADWGDALDAVVSRYRGRGKLVLAFDEFQWMVEASPELPSLLQERWDRRWQGRRKVLVILCSSHVGLMEREVLGKKSPLFGRSTAQIHLRPFGFREAALFHPTASLVDRARIYFICGGVPLYLRCFSAKRSIEKNIAATFCHELAPLFREADFLLREELREVQTYHAVLIAMASGATTSRAIARETGVGERSLQYYLKQLVELGYLSRRHPLTGGPPIARHVRYDLEDPLLRFWFRFIYPSASFILHAGPERAIAARIRPELDAYFGHCFERLCREALPTLYAREGVSTRFEIGEYWDKGTQIDVVSLRGDGRTDLGECKWGAVRSRRSLVAELEARVGSYPNERNATIGRRIFTRDRVPRGTRDDARWHCLEDLYAGGRTSAAKATTAPKKKATAPKKKTPAPKKARAPEKVLASKRARAPERARAPRKSKRRSKASVRARSR